MTDYNKTKDGRPGRRNDAGSDRDDPNRRGYAPFAKDKRKRITRIEKNEPGRKENDGTKPESGERRSYNPNFTKDNKPVGKPYQERRDGNKPYQKNSPYRKDGKSGPRKRIGTPPEKREYPKFRPEEFDRTIRLNRYIAASGISSRREADESIKMGLVTVNGQVVTELGTKVMPGDEVRYDGRLIRGEKKVYILMNKPKGYVTSLEDPHAEKTVMDLLKHSVQERVYPVGRLDKSSLGVLLITNDGDLTTKLTHPSYNKKKIYHVALDRSISKTDMEKLTEGITLEDGEVFADAVSYVGESKKEVGIEIHSGKNRIVRRMFDHLGYKVQKLDRVYFAGLTKKNLKRGAWRFLTPREVQILRSGMYE